MTYSAVKTHLERVLEKNLQDLVRGIRSHKDDETKYISECIEEIKHELKTGNFATKANAANKLAYLQMLGYDISWAAFNIVEVMSSPKFSFKRIGYLAASQSFRDNTDVLMLTSNLIRKDLTSGKIYETSVALSGLSCFMTADLAKDLCGNITALTTSPKPYIRKKAVLLLYKVFLKYPDALRASFPRLRDKLEDPDPGVQSAAVNVICELARKNPQNYLSLSPLFFKLMTTSTNNWVLIKIIKLFGALTPLEPRLGKKLIEPLTNLIHNTSAMSLLYECINTVLAGVPDRQASIQLCVQKLHILIEHSDQNLKYLGLLAMNKILKHHPKSVQIHKDLILNCLEDKDESIRLRALDLLHGMVTKKNLVEIVKNLIRHLNAPNIGAHFRSELICKIVKICSQENYHYVVSFEWYISVLVELAQLNESKNGELLANQLLDVAVRVAAVRAFTVSQMAILLQSCKQMTGRSNWVSLCEVIYAAAWICGEFTYFLEDPQETLEAMLETAGLGDVHGHIQSVLVLNVLKFYCKLTARWFTEAVHNVDVVEDGEEDERKRMKQGLSEDLNLNTDQVIDVQGLLDRLLELTNFLMDKISLFVHSADLEVQERAVSIHQLLRLVAKHLAKLRVGQSLPTSSSSLRPEVPTLLPLILTGSEHQEETIPATDDPKSEASPQFSATTDRVTDNPQTTTLLALQALLRELCDLFAGELNPVAPKAQRKVPVPEGLDLDAWINEPPPVAPHPDYQRPSSPHASIKSSGKKKKPIREKVDASKESSAEKHSNIFGGLVEPEDKPRVQLTTSEMEELRKRRLQMQEVNPHYLKPSKASSQSMTASSELGDSAAQPEPSASSNFNSPKQTPKLASSDRFAYEMQKQFKEVDKKISSKCLSKLDKPGRVNSKRKQAKNARVNDDDYDDDDLSFNKAAVSTVVDLPEGVALNELDSPDDELDVNDPHRLLNIPFDFPAPSTAASKDEPLEKRQKKSEKNGTKKSNKELRVLKKTEKNSNGRLAKSGKKKPTPNNARMDEYVAFDEEEEEGDKLPKVDLSYNHEKEDIDFWLHGLVDERTLTTPTAPTTAVTSKPAVAMTEAAFADLLAGGVLTGLVRAKVRCPASVSEVGHMGQHVLTGLLDRLCGEIEGLTVVECIGLNASLYAETCEKHPICLLLKISETTGSVTIDCKALNKQNCEEFVNKVKPIIKKFK